MSDEPVIDSSDFRRVLGNFPTGVTVVTTIGDEGPKGVAIGSFASISLDPPLVGFFLGTGSHSGVHIENTGAFCVNILSSDQADVCGVMASKADDKFDGIDWAPTPGTGSPVLPGVHGFIDCRLDRVVQVGDHNLIVGRVLSLECVEADSDPLLFYRGRYGAIAR